MSTGPTASQLRARAIMDTLAEWVADKPLAPALERNCLACNREAGEPMCNLCQSLELAEAEAK